MKKKGIWKKILPVLLPIAVLAAMAALDPNTRNLADVADDIDPWWFLAALGSMALYYLFDTLMFHLAAKYMNLKHTFPESLLTTMYGLFYSAITPLQAGGQPMQVVQLKKRGIPVGLSTSVLVLKFLAYQLSITLLGTLGFIFLGKDVLQGGVTMLVFYIIGYLFYLGTVVLCVLALVRTEWLFQAGEKLINFLAKKRILKKQEKIDNAHATWARTIADYAKAAKFALGERLGMFYIWLAGMGTAVCYMAVTYFLYRGMGHSEYGLWYVVLLQCLLYIAVSFLPVPGGSVASEGGFYLVFSRLFPGASRFPAVLLWRGITYYLTLLLGVVAVMVEGFRSKKLPPAEEMQNGQDAVQTADTLPPAGGGAEE
ncbi:MAG TPA: lysylphosphatidylglycerol synthase transmembrane domain-containing protein [Feifaniaceae bacterium]|nr:lysylphosphatidylglycerol synthase transmembrane domain-containing protein [Feifaniaceae bacterium]